MRKLGLCVVLCLMATLCFSACGGADPTVVPTPAVVATATNAPAPPPTAAATTVPAPPTTAAEPTLIATAQVTTAQATAVTQAIIATKPAQPAAQGDAEKGAELFATTCAACHGPKGEGVKGLGKDMTTSKFIAGLSDTELLAFVKQGRPTTDPLNTTGVMMPPKGGNPALTDAELRDIIAYIRTIHK
ncbi:MAG: c-type cytochrome [Caldilineaceae bacterium]